MREADVREGGQEIVRLSYGSGATITRVNKGLRRRRNQTDLGFTIDPRTGWWAKGDDEDDEGGDGITTRQKVVPAVEESKNALLLRPTAAFGALSASCLMTLRHGLLRGIETVFQLEQGEILSESLPSREDCRAILFYEASEGGAGVLSRLAIEPDALARVARRSTTHHALRPSGRPLQRDRRDLTRRHGSRVCGRLLSLPPLVLQPAGPRGDRSPGGSHENRCS